MNRLLIGCSLFALYIGFLVGASNTPVAGAVIAGLLGLVVAGIPLLEAWLNTSRNRQTENAEDAIPPASAQSIGTLLIVVSAGLMIGTAFGIGTRYYFWDTTVERFYPVQMGPIGSDDSLPDPPPPPSNQ